MCLVRVDLLVAALAVSVVGLSSAAAQERDPWFGPDKALHFSASASLALVGYGIAATQTSSPPLRATISGGFALGAGLAKEGWDLAGHGDASWRDLTWDIVGTATGVLVASAIDWILRRAGDPAPAKRGHAWLSP